MRVLESVREVESGSASTREFDGRKRNAGFCGGRGKSTLDAMRGFRNPAHDRGGHCDANRSVEGGRCSLIQCDTWRIGAKDNEL